MTEPKKLESTIRRLLEKYPEPPNVLRILGAALALFPRVPPSYSRVLLEQMLSILSALSPVADLRGRERERRNRLKDLPDRSWSQKASEVNEEKFEDLADVHDRVSVMEIVARRAADASDPNLLRKVVSILTQIVDAQCGEDIFSVVPILVKECLTSLRRLELRSDLENLLRRTTGYIRQGTSVAQLRAKDEELRFRNHQLLLNIAAGWLYLGNTDLAGGIVDEGRSCLFDSLPSFPSVLRTDFACQYVASVALMPVAPALERLIELFPRIGPLGDSYSTNSHLSLVRLQLIDAVVRAVLQLASPDPSVDNYLAVSLN
jgi:hypothetical protein